MSHTCVAGSTAEHKFKNKEGPDETFSELPLALRDDIIISRWKYKLQAVPFFKSLASRHMAEVCRSLRALAVAPGDMIMEVGAEQDELLILSSGQAKTLADVDGHETVFEVGTFWGELQFLGLERERTLSVVAVSFCEVATLAPADIAHVLQEAEDLRFKLESYGKMRKAVEDRMRTEEDFDLDAMMQSLDAKHKRDAEAHSLKMAVSPRSGRKLKGNVARDTDMKGLNDQMKHLQLKMDSMVKEIDVHLQLKMDSLVKEVDAKFDQIISAIQTQR
jgi:CRP-like cAMP-binding protein